MKWKKISDLDCLCDLKDSKKALVFFHGYGTNAYDLLPLGDLFKEKDYDLIFPQAPNPLKGLEKAWAWLYLEIEQVSRSKNSSDLKKSLIDENQISETRKKLTDFYKQLENSYDKIVLCGFSQGGMIVLDLSIYAHKKPDGIVLFSSAIGLEYEKHLIQSIKDLPYLQTHGKSDPTLSYELGINLSDFLKKTSSNGKSIFFEGGHEIPPILFDSFKDFVSKKLL